jgi:hypothetical protein
VQLLAKAAVGLIILGSCVGDASAQTPPQNSQVEIKYVTPQKRDYQPIYNRLNLQFNRLHCNSEVDRKAHF